MVDAYEDPGTPETRGGWWYLWWLVARQRGRAAAAAVLGIVWMALLAAQPYLMQRAVDGGLVPGRLGVLAGWTGAMFVVGAVTAWLSILRHRTMTRLRMDAGFRTAKVVVGHVVRLGAALPGRTGAGEVVTIGVGDVKSVSDALTMVGPGVGSLVFYGVVAGLLVTVSPRLALVVLLGLPVLALVTGPLTRRLQGVESEYRERQAVLTARIADLAGGLRVLGGLGGKGLFADAFRADSRRLLDQGYRVGAVASWMQALAVGLPTLFLAVVAWLAARMTAQGELSVGQLVAVYGYVAVLVGPVTFFVEMAYDLNRGVVAARRVVRLLRLTPEPDEGTLAAPEGPAELYDPASGLRLAPGRLTALAAARPADATAVVDRLGRYGPTDATWGGVRLDAVPLADVRHRILVADHEAYLFAGPLREMVATGRLPAGDGPCEEAPPEHRPGGTAPRKAATAETRPGRNAPREKVPAEDTAGAGTPRPETTAEGTPGGDVPHRAVTADRTPGGHPPHRAATAQDPPGGNAPHGAATAGAPAVGAATAGAPAGGAARAQATGRPVLADAPSEATRGERPRDEDALRRAVYAAAAEDVVRGLPEGLDSVVSGQGRSLSGGQRQRLRLVRALLADPEVLLAVEPTSALDAHTEATAAGRLRAARDGRTTLVTSTSPLVLDQADTVVFLADGKVVASGPHRRLLAEEPRYRALVARDTGITGTEGTAP
ncbi:ABC transporter transmembrane domain-containing protein [Streptomyces misionensis]|uniref:ABC transporter transmembrane domain-containing protein n=1 Tax=Streptomyces misionensis TaxID=67331 RepID=UPI0021BD86BA|nr:ABC transporter transmembrane domain-containing protein [Streptomyces misionensis]